MVCYLIILTRLFKIIKIKISRFLYTNNKGIEQVTFDVLFQPLTKAFHQIFTPSLIFNSSALPAS